MKPKTSIKVEPDIETKAPMMFMEASANMKAKRQFKGVPIKQEKKTKGVMHTKF